jgi:hypothetical protein
VHLRAVSAAARIGASLEPFSPEQIVITVDASDVLHFDPTCGEIREGRTLPLALSETYLYRHCGRCLRPYRFADRVERYGDAVEELQRAKFLAREAEEADGIAALRLIQHVEATCRRAVRKVSTGEVAASTVGDVERYAASIRKLVNGLAMRGRDTYLDWAASISVDVTKLPKPPGAQDRWRGRVEHARGEMRRGGWPAFCGALGVSENEITEYCEATRVIRASEDAHLLAVADGEEEGDLILWAAGSWGAMRSGVWYSIVPDWARQTAATLGATFEPIGRAGLHEDPVVEIYAELAKTRPGPESLTAARRLSRGRGR